MTSAGFDEHVDALRSYAEVSGWGILYEKPIQSGYQVCVTDGRDRVPVSFYSTGKAVVGGKDSALKTIVETWWRERSTPSFSRAANPMPAAGVRPGSTAKFHVPPTRYEDVKKVLTGIYEFASIADPALDPHQAFRVELRRGSERIVATQFRSGTLCVQGRMSDLFEGICATLESAFSQPFAERGARYVPDSKRDQVIAVLNDPKTERNSQDWMQERLGAATYDFLPPNAGKTYLSGAGLLLALKGSGATLSDYSVVVMPFARAYEGFLIQLAVHLGVCRPEDFQADARPGKVGQYLNEIKQRIEAADKLRYGGLASTLLSAWTDSVREFLYFAPLADPYL